MSANEQSVPDGEQAGVWMVTAGKLAPTRKPDTYREDGTENLTYSNPYGMEVERVWFDGRIVFAIESGEVEIAFDEQRVAQGNKVAQEFQIVYAVDLDDDGKLRDDKEPEMVEGQYNIYDSVPGMEKYSPLWQFNYVIVPRDYEPNTLRSEADCLNSGYTIERSTIVEN